MADMKPRGTGTGRVIPPALKAGGERTMPNNVFPPRTRNAASGAAGEPGLRDGAIKKPKDGQGPRAGAFQGFGSVKS